MRSQSFFIAILVCVGGVTSVGQACGQVTDPWADRVVDYTPGEGLAAEYANPLAALDSPARVNYFGDSVTPFNSAYWWTDVVTVGRGGSLTVAFDEAVTDDAANPYGVDVLIFGNQFFTTDSEGRVSGLFSEGGSIELFDGSRWVMVPGATAEGGFPSLGFLGIADLAFGGDMGTGPTDFTMPVDPSLNPIGLTREQLAAAYGGSGGGLGIDIGALGLAQVTMIRISNAADATGTPEIDGFADVSPVPAPGSLALALVVAAARRRRS